MEPTKALEIRERNIRRKQKEYMTNLVNQLKKSPSLNLNVSLYRDGSVYTYFTDFGDVVCLHLSISNKDINNLEADAKKALDANLVDVERENVIISFVYDNSLINLPLNKISLWQQKRLKSVSPEAASDCKKEE